jgi:hypothetical protein
MKKIVYLSGILALALPTTGNCSSEPGYDCCSFRQGYDRRNGNPASLNELDWPNWDKGETGKTPASKLKIYKGIYHWLCKIKLSGMSEATLKQNVADANELLNRINTMQPHNYPLTVTLQEDCVKTTLSFVEAILTLRNLIDHFG